MPRIRTLIVAGGSALLLALASASACLAEGAPSISAAPPVAVNQLEAGNIGCPEANGRQKQSFWLLTVLAGDRLTVNWETAAPLNYGTTIQLYPVGTNDFNLGEKYPNDYEGEHENQKGELTYTVPTSGVMPLSFVANCDAPGAYSFTAYVRHIARLSIARRLTLSTHGSVVVRAYNAEGHPLSTGPLDVSIQREVRGRWKTVGSEPVGVTSTSVRVDLPSSLRGHSVKLRAVGTGANYIPTTSSTAIAAVR